jgi:hypothetical protein
MLSIAGIQSKRSQARKSKYCTVRYGTYEVISHRTMRCTAVFFSTVVSVHLQYGIAITPEYIIFVVR